LATTNKNFKVKNGLDVGGNTAITGDANVTGKLSITARAGDEGGEIFLSNAVTNTTITNGVTIDIYKDRLRFFEQGGDARGFYVDITTGGSAASTNLVGGGGGTASNSFATVSANGTSVVADSSTDTLTITPGDGLSITGNATSDTITFTPNVAGASANGIVTTGTQTFAGEKTFSNTITASANIVANTGFVSADAFRLDTTYTTGPSQAGEITWDPDNETAQLQLDAHTIVQIGQEQVLRVKNSDGANAIPIRTAVMFAGAAGDTVTVTSANSANIAVYPSDYMVGITAEEIAADGFGFVTQFGVLPNVNTAAFTLGNLLYVDPANPGQFVTTRPSAPAWQTPIAAVTKVGSGSSGRILVRTIPGIKIGSVEGVEITSATENDILRVNASGIVVNSNLATAGIANLSGATFTGNVAGTNANLSGNVNATTFYGSGEGLTSIPSIVTDDTKPSSPVDGQVWFNSATGKTYVYYEDGTSGQWVEIFGAKDVQDLQNRTTTLEGIANNRNFLINGGFDFWQRGTSSTTSGVYITDRWIHARTAGTHTVSQSTDTPADADVQYSLSFASTNGTAPTIAQRIESINSLQFAGQPVTLSVWAKSTTGTGALNWSTSYPTATDNWAAETADASGTFAASMTVGSWTRYTATFTANALATRGYSVKIFRNVTTTSTTTLYAGVQLELGSSATRFRPAGSTYTEEQAACWRYYQRHITIMGRTDATGVWKILGNPIGEILRATPTSAIVGTISTPAAGGNIGTNITLTISTRDMYYTSTGSSSNGAWLNFDDVKVECEL
jgi:hypothetical protein